MKILLTKIIVTIFLSSAVAMAETYELHTDYGKVLSKHVDEKGLVNYQALKAAPSDLNKYLNSLDSLDSSEFQKFNSQKKLAFWLNAYNAFTLKLIIDNYPIKSSFIKSALWPKNSIKQINDAWGQKRFRAMGQSFSLDQIEHEVIRQKFKEPRIHMALVCAAKSCPLLRREPYIGARLEQQLEDQSIKFLKDPQKFRVNIAAKEVQVSSIFKWYGKDFIALYFDPDSSYARLGIKKNQTAVLSFAATLLDESKLKQLAAVKKITYINYDWSLNEQ